MLGLLLKIAIMFFTAPIVLSAMLGSALIIGKRWSWFVTIFLGFVNTIIIYQIDDWLWVWLLISADCFVAMFCLFLIHRSQYPWLYKYITYGDNHLK